jgi:hypothetical protein
MYIQEMRTVLERQSRMQAEFNDEATKLNSRIQVAKPYSTSVCGVKLLVYGALSYYCMRPSDDIQTHLTHSGSTVYNAFR